jgi:hypothetical protein
MNQLIGARVYPRELKRLIRDMTEDEKRRALEMLQMRKGLKKLTGRPYSKELCNYVEQKLKKEVKVND